MTLSVSAGQDRFPDSDKYYGGLDLTRDLANGVSAAEIQAFMANNPDLVRSEETRALINNLDTSSGSSSSSSSGGGYGGGSGGNNFGGGSNNNTGIIKNNNFPVMPGGGGGFTVPESQVSVFDPSNFMGINDSFNNEINQQNNVSQDQTWNNVSISNTGDGASIGNYSPTSMNTNNASIDNQAKAKELALNYMFGKEGLVFS